MPPQRNWRAEIGNLSAFAKRAGLELIAPEDASAPKKTASIAAASVYRYGHSILTNRPEWSPSWCPNVIAPFVCVRRNCILYERLKDGAISTDAQAGPGHNSCMEITNCRL